MGHSEIGDRREQARARHYLDDAVDLAVRVVVALSKLGKVLACAWGMCPVQLNNNASLQA